MLVSLVKMLFSALINILGKFFLLFVMPWHISYHEVAGMGVMVNLVGVMVLETSCSIAPIQMQAWKPG